MNTCRDIDIVKYIEQTDLTEEDRNHMNDCAHCRAELIQLKQTLNILTPYFSYLFHATCPQAEKLIDHMTTPGRLTDPKLQQHITACPACARIKTLLDKFETETKDPMFAETAPLPESIAKSIRKKRVVERTRHALETMMDKSTKTKELIKDMIAKTLAGPDIQGAPAARDDLTHGRDEVRPEAEPASKPDETEDKDK